jgi:hypothetical protein
VEARCAAGESGAAAVLGLAPCLGRVSAMAGDFSNLWSQSNPIQDFDLDGKADREA